MAIVPTKEFELPQPQTGGASGPLPGGLKPPPGMTFNHVAPPTASPGRPSPSDNAFVVTAKCPSASAPRLALGAGLDAGAQRLFEGAQRNFRTGMGTYHSTQPGPQRVEDFKAAPTPYDDAMAARASQKPGGASAYFGVSVPLATGGNNGVEFGKPELQVDVGPTGPAGQLADAARSGVMAGVRQAIKGPAMGLGINGPTAPTGM